MIELPRLSVIVPAFNNVEVLQVTLDALARQTMPATEFEVIVCDDGSTEPLEPAVAAFADRLTITCLRSERNQGRSANRNLGAAAARAEILVFLDSDTVAHPDLLDQHLAFHANRPGRPGVLLGRRLEVDWTAAAALRQGQVLSPAMLDADRDDVRYRHCSLPQHWQDFRRAPWLLGFSHNTSMDRASFAAVGGFDEAMLRWGLEDVELCYRIFHHHGCPPDLFEFGDDAIAYHLPHYRPAGALLATLDNLGYVTRKHPRFDFEAMHSPGVLGEVMGRVGRYGDTIATCRKEGLGRPERLPASLRDALAASRTLAIGFGVCGLALGAGSHTFDHDAPLDEGNWHLLGLMLQHFKTGQFQHLVSIDLWRFFLPDDLNLFVTKALHKADQLHLVATVPGPDPLSLLPLPFLGEVTDLAAMLAGHFTMERADTTGATVLTLR